MIAIKNKLASYIVLTLIGTSFLLPLQNVNAQLGVPVDTRFDFQTTKTYIKTFVLDNLAYTIAKTFIQSMTADIVDWINSGYQGNPAFLDNPQGFFLDSADQVTGAFIAGSGPLTALCSPFNLDLRLNLALDQVQLERTRYACTLKTVIDNARNAHANVSVGTSPNGMTLGDIVNGDVTKNPNDISINGASVDNTDKFLNGDFEYGGWPAFVALTTEPQNNPYGAYLQARSDLARKQAEAQAQYNRDLDRGKGFLSWEKCKEVGRASQNDQAGIDAIRRKTAGDTTVRDIPVGSEIVFKSCTTQTPGSVVAGTLQTNVDSPIHQLELADSLGEIVDAALRQMVNKMLTSGLRSLSGASGGAISVTTDLRDQATRIQTRMYTNNQITALPQVQQASSTITELRNKYSEAITSLEYSRQRFESAKSCYSNIYMHTSEIDTRISEIDTMLATLRPKLREAENDLQSLAMSMTGLNQSGFGTREQQEEQARIADQAVQIATDAYRKADTSMAAANQALARAREIEGTVSSFNTYCSNQM